MQATSVSHYLKHIATQTDSWQFIAHTCMVRLKLHLIYLLSTYYTNKFASNTQHIVPMDL